MLAPVTRMFVLVLALGILVVLVSVAWLAMRGPGSEESARIAEALRSTAPPGEPSVYAACASCHLHDGSGRPDGAIPRLNGQRRAVIENKLNLLRAGVTGLAVMEPFARALRPEQIAEVAAYLSGLPETAVPQNEAAEEERMRGAALFAEHCASCHGANGEGNDGLLASRLCGQYAGYLHRRLGEIAARIRGDSDAIMQGVVDMVPEGDLRLIVAWLAPGNGCVPP